MYPFWAERGEFEGGHPVDHSLFISCHICLEGGIALGAATELRFSAVFLVADGLLFAWWMCGIYAGLFRQELQRKYHLQNSPCDPCMVHCWCAMCQEHREMQGRLSDSVVLPMTVFNPPPHQQMEAQESATNETRGCRTLVRVMTMSMLINSLCEGEGIGFPGLSRVIH